MDNADNNKQVLIIGAGIGGLATALRLVHQGFKVRIVEKNQTPGGCLNQLKTDGFRFDIGPSFFSMSYEFREFAKECGIPMPFVIEEINPLFSVYLNDGRCFRIKKDLDDLSEQFDSIEPDFFNKMQDYLGSAKTNFDTYMPKMVKQNHNSLISYLKAITEMPLDQGPKLMRNFYQEVSLYFKSDEVRQILSLSSLLLGRIPFRMNGIYSLLSYVEFKHDGYYQVKGGMYSIVEGIVANLEAKDVEFIYNTEIKTVTCQDGKLTGVYDSYGKEYEADYYVCNADAAVFRGKVLKRNAYSPARLDRMSWTLAPLTIYLGIDTKVSGLDHHNYFLGSNYKDYVSGLLSDTVPDEIPYFYVNVPSRSNPDCAPEGMEALYILCPMPDMRSKKNWTDTNDIVNNLIENISTRINFDLKSHIVSRTVYNPPIWSNMFNLHRGCGFGLAHDLKQSGWFRPSNFDKKLSNLFYVGASTVPGSGLPMCIISSKLTVDQIKSLI